MGNATDGRDLLLLRLREDLMGPGERGEVLDDRPSDRYLTGILFPAESELPVEEDEELGVGAEDDEDVPDVGVSLGRAVRPATMGISFGVASDDPAPSLRLRVTCGTYRVEYVGASAAPDAKRRLRRDERWPRTQHTIDLTVAVDVRVPVVIELTPHGLDHGQVYVRAVKAADGYSVTVAFVNRNARGDGGADAEMRAFFQTGIEVEPVGNTRLIPRPSVRIGSDADARAASLIYRDAKEYAVGHTCSATWDVDGEGGVLRIASSWLPRYEIQAVSADGAPEFEALDADPLLRPREAEWLAACATPSALVAALELVPNAYEAWLDTQASRIASLPQTLRDQAREHIATCRRAAERMREAIEVIGRDEDVRHAFRLANLAMELQRKWARGKSLVWRPFQLAFQLMALCSVADRGHSDRELMDLLWFPTGGGKTEAYLGLTAFVLILRRLRDPVAGAGVNVLMRYTLRLLTVQQFERAATMICACEHLRRGERRPFDLRHVALGDGAFSIGLWVGNAATPSSVWEAHQSKPESKSTPRQLTVCPVCRSGKSLQWGKPFDPKKYNVSCGNDACEFAKVDPRIPVWTVDEDVYRELPSLLLGTVDKFAQIVREPRTGRLFGLGTPHDPPELIIQDELHLISGPLGTITALYEIAIDELCRRGTVRPKVIGSTATIRRAEEQVRALFNRGTFQFPPPCIDASNSGFAARDEKRPGRLYVGVTTAGRSPKFTLQAVCASLLQSANSGAITDAKQLDAYWTLVGYFNSLRELGGALVLMMDDVAVSMAEYANRRTREDVRHVEAPVELTSRVDSVRPVLDKLEIPCGAEGACDVVLASNMISVGVDVDRLGLMVVNGQTKGIAEYIQATSRVGRAEVPGLVVTVENEARPRDRSHFETFRTWHQTLYREVEATSVTPFASRALDRALHGVLVALVRHRVKGMKTSPRLKDVKAVEGEALEVLKRANAIVGTRAPEELEDARRVLGEFVRTWQARGDSCEDYWSDDPAKRTLLMSAEVAAAERAQGATDARAVPTPNSMREVEPSTVFVLRKGIKYEPEGTDGAA